MTIDEVKQYFEDNDYEESKEYIPVDCTCRYGVTYTTEWKGSYGAIWRGWDLMQRCCCWVCHNHNCKEPRNEVIENCDNACELWSHTHYCEVYKLKKELREYKSILNELYEDYDTWGDPHEEIPMYEKLVKETEEKINNL